jgi:hypothetical protein
MGADKSSSRRRWRLQQNEHGFQHTSPTHYPRWPSPRIYKSATGPKNQLSTSQTRERSRTQDSSLTDLTGQAGEHHRSDRSLLVKPGNFHRTTLIPVRPVSTTSQTGPSQKAPKHQTGLPSSKTTQTRNSRNTRQQRTHPNTRAKTQQGLHRSDR